MRALTRVANANDEDLLAAYAVDASVQQVEERCRQIRNVAPQSGLDAWRAWTARTLTVWRDDRRGLMRFTVEVPVEDGELVCRALDCAVAAGDVTRGLTPCALWPAEVDPDEGDGRSVAQSRGGTWRAQQADAFVAIMRSYLDGRRGSDGGVTADHYQVVVHVDGKALVGNGHELGEATRVAKGLSDPPIDTAKRLLCDGSVVLVAEDEHGKPLDVGRKQRTVSTALRRALYARDRGCTFPGCERKRYLDAHHVTHWIDGGATAPENVTLLCTYHHRLLHKGAFSIVKESDGALRFVSADGHTVPRGGGTRTEHCGNDGIIGRDASRDGFVAGDNSR